MSNDASYFPTRSAAAASDPPPPAPGFTCPACRSHLRKTDPKHARDETCKFKDVESVSWSCPGCVARRNRAHESHTNDHTCQGAVARLPEGSSREMGTTHPRDGRVPASADPTARMRDEGRADGVPGSEPPALPDAAAPAASSESPEILSPEVHKGRKGGLITDLVGDWVDRRGIQVVFRARGKHSETIRPTLKALQFHLQPCLLKQCLPRMPCSSLVMPYEAIFGRHPPLMATVGEEAGELLELKLGDLVEFFRKPFNEDLSGWHGPAEVVNLTSLQDGILRVKWQGRVIAVRVQDVRAAMMCATFRMQLSGPLRVFKAELENQTGNVLRLGWMRQGQNWVECQANRAHSNLLAAGLYLSAVCMNLQGVISFRCGVGAQNLPAVSFDDTLLLWWNVQKPGLFEWFHCCLPGNQVINVPRFIGDPDVANGAVSDG
eukprot:s677_g22.t1